MSKVEFKAGQLAEEYVGLNDRILFEYNIETNDYFHIHVITDKRVISAAVKRPRGCLGLFFDNSSYLPEESVETIRLDNVSKIREET